MQKLSYYLRRSCAFGRDEINVSLKSEFSIIPKMPLAMNCAASQWRVNANFCQELTAERTTQKPTKMKLVFVCLCECEPLQRARTMH